MATNTINNDLDVYFGKVSVITPEGKQAPQPAVFVGSNNHDFSDMAFTLPEIRDFIEQLTVAANASEAHAAAGTLED